jgi:hypothetical protein
MKQVNHLATFSPEWQAVLTRGKCPNGDKGGPFDYNEGTGPLVHVNLTDRLNSSKAFRMGTMAIPTSWLLLARPAVRDSLKFPKVTAFREDSSFRCDKCKGNWAVFYRTAQVVPGQLAVLGVTADRRSSVSMGYDDSIRDNRTGTESMIATVKVSRRWLQKVEIHWEEAKTKSTTGRANVSFKYAGTDVEREVSQSLASSLSLSSETEQVLEQTLQVTVPAHNRVTIRLNWKQIWQEGQITVQFPDGTTAQIPYRAAVDVGFDQENIQG